MWKDFFYFRKANAELYFFVDFAFHIYVYMGSVSSKGRVFGTGSRGDRRNKNFLAGVHEMEEKESLRYSYDKPKEERWYWLLLIQIQPIPSNFCNVDCLLLLHILFAIPESRR